MKIILTKDVPGTGKKGQVLEVADGFARNFLIKKGLAEVATKDAVSKLEQQSTKLKKIAEEELQENQKLAHTLDGAEIEISAKVNDEGTLYAGITPQKIVQEIKKQVGVAISFKQVVIPKPIKDTGEHEVKIKFLHGLESDLRVSVYQG
ncbi:MAG: 50S ribosomal protein L9 [Candidatus Magasanikbacteria bacterium]|nr:50S ribosomal protein L9 [Candidatus Magasanikbacteria bacterium]